MIPSQLVASANHLWQSTLFAGVAGLLTLFLRKNRAHVRYWLWLLASVKFLLPFSLLVAVGGLLGPHTTAAVAPSGLVLIADFSSFVEHVGEPFTTTLPQFAMPAVQRSYTSVIVAVLIFVWAAGFVTLVCRWTLRWRRIRASVRKASPLDLQIGLPVKSSPAFGEPGVFGIFRPVLLLPDKILDCLTAREMESIVAHELCHVRRRDNLATVIHMAVEVVFWFHPLVWWLGARLIEERERACDEEVLRNGGEPSAYAEGILKICELYLASPLACVAGVTGGDLKRRIEAIMGNRVAHRLNYAKKAILAVAAIAVLVTPIVVGITNTPAVQAQSSPPAPSVATPRFEVASIKPCKGEPAAAGRGPKGGNAGASFSPVTFNLPCMPVRFFINLAYVISNFRPDAVGPSAVLEGGPAWIDSDRYQISAKAGDAVSKEMMNGPMLRALLEERFRLKFHRETREVPIYALTVAKRGLKLQPSSGGSCTPRDLSQPSLPPGEKPWCGQPRGSKTSRLIKTDLPGGTMAQFAQALGLSGRMVVDKTGITEKFDFQVEYAPDGADLSDELTAPSIDSVLGKLGLRLERAKGAREFLVIDRVEKPSEN
jgi:bla regulator protein BlaR1